MPDYKEMYLTLFRASEQAIQTLIQAQQACEEMYISQSATDIKGISLLAEQKAWRRNDPSSMLFAVQR